MNPLGGNVYFVQRPDNGPIKIGYAVDPVRRLGVLQTGSVEQLTLVAYFDAVKEHERLIHRMFAHCRIRNEWFRAEPDLISFIANAKASGALPISEMDAVSFRPRIKQTTELWLEVSSFLKHSGMSPTAFGRSVANDGNFVGDLRRGRRLWPETEKKVRMFIASQRGREAA